MIKVKLAKSKGVNHDRFISTLAKIIQDKPLLKLIRKYLQAGVIKNVVVSSTAEGNLTRLKYLTEKHMSREIVISQRKMP